MRQGEKTKILNNWDTGRMTVIGARQEPILNNLPCQNEIQWSWPVSVALIITLSSSLWVVLLLGAGQLI